MPFDFLKRKKADDAERPSGPTASANASDGQPERGIVFDGLTEEWRIVGHMHIGNRLSDALNKREAIAISDVQWAPIDGSVPLAAAPGLKAVDPYDLIIVLASESSLPPLTEAEKSAHKIHKVAYDVAIEVPPFRVIGTVYLHPGTQPEQLLDRATEMFQPVVAATAFFGDEALGTEMDAVLVNRFYMRGIEQIDRRTGEPHPKLPGSPMGGTSWQERSR